MATAAAAAPTTMIVPATASSRPDISLGCLRCLGAASECVSGECGCFRWRGAGWDTTSLQSERTHALSVTLGAGVSTSGVPTSCRFRAAESRLVAVAHARCCRVTTMHHWVELRVQNTEENREI